MADTSEQGPIRASGCLVYRRAGGADGQLEVLVAHRPRYDDWDFPKGKLESGETDLECAIRETLEETGYSGVIGEELPADEYQVRGRDKVVRWWLLEQTGGDFEVNEEVDRVRWVSPGDALQLLSYEHPKSLLRFLPGQG